MLLEHSDILKILPHRPPMLLIDRADDCVPGVSSKASLYIDPAWDVFRGHFPDAPVLPGVYLLESMAQSADLLLLTISGNESLIPYFFSADHMRFLRPVMPGDMVDLFAALSSAPGGGLYECRVSASVGGHKCASGLITIALR